MEKLFFKAEQHIAKTNDKVKYWYLIQEGTVMQKFDFASIKLAKNSIIGMFEKDIYLCEYIALEDVTVIAFECNNAKDLKNVITGQEKIRSIFLKTAIEQRQNTLNVYSDMYDKAMQFHAFVESVYGEYQSLCTKNKLEEQSFMRMERFSRLQMQHRADEWEIANSNSLANVYMNDYIKLMEKDDSLTIGVIMEAAAQMRRFTLGIIDIEGYLSYNRNILISESQTDLLTLYFDLMVKVKTKGYDIKPVEQMIDAIEGFANELNIYNKRTVNRRMEEIRSYDVTSSDNAPVYLECDILNTDCMGKILEFAGYKDDDITNISKMIHTYFSLPDMYSMDNEIYSMRKKITNLFYEIYYKVFVQAVSNERNLTPILRMFLNFGFMDVSFIGEENTRMLYDLSAHLSVCRSLHVYTIYEWLKCIYKGAKEPSKNELDMNYTAQLTELKRAGHISAEQAEAYKNNSLMKVEFEIKNMFATVNKVTYGKVTTFCPILHANDLLYSVDKMLLMADRIENALNEVRKTDYSVFYREVQFSDPEKGVNCEKLMKEVMPDIILMPNAGTKGMMWQETATVKSDSEARFMLPILTVQDADEMMLEIIGKYRWEMCRKLEGVRWNDFREKSLTAEYCAYIQFYRKNNELSQEAKDKIKSTLLNAKNNYREVFVRDYINWIKYESKGSFRLNKVARDILVRYCPFVKEIREKLKVNPLYQTSITRFENDNTAKLKRYQGFNLKYEKAGGVIAGDLKENILFYEM
ncbi:MAG: cyclic nucleotide-binding domain-containing protein [Lachnospira sp.]|nr:cyclic nucleotide-binding domain-containing protein [Lachnospira sp.]